MPTPSDLPSQEMVAHSDDIDDFPTYLQRVLLPLAVAWRSGRLVDREAIDYKAAAEAMNAWVRFVVDGADYPFGDINAPRAVLVAAIGDTE